MILDDGDNEGANEIEWRTKECVSMTDDYDQIFDRTTDGKFEEVQFGGIKRVRHK
ncbi:uncharacterized protein ASCRUDRAFT_83148 [Ascoidea rubescens DSM 1968]|uniref:Uncharacterized protein n=1 Tax=Ascoidea rubescens DSM 1968 TaxID=1344418 RepID=A0A1D2V8W7_9ASCO|nr:hypothetical protein ASCRUDRAFT_83148 [Ascoidea rubescens DSM 1968]ODV57893.1 hypothetical protein ASCRUDRAFT_83148 [Ascoidea rubescens DSM 1968]